VKAISVALLYGYHDYALEMARDQADLFTIEERRLIDTALGSDESSPAETKVPGRRQLASALNRLATKVREPNDAWSVSDRDLGNPAR
jgi:hypothetical protein